ncbi:type I restriction endonuclease subunit R, partial [Enterococcus faecalis]
DVTTSRDISTHDILGKRLHTYTIKDAIGDGNVLGFDVTYFKPHWVVENAESDLSEQEYEKEVYQSDVYRRQVVQDSLDNWKKTSSGPLI